MKPKVTIGICVKNSAFSIRKTIESVLAQDYPHELMEVIVVDGYSTDNTVRIIKGLLSDSDIKSRIFYENKGLGFARQIVVDNANGEYIVWADGDMILSENFVKKQVKFMEQNHRVGIAIGRHGIIDMKNFIAVFEDIPFVIHESRRDLVKKLPGTGGAIYRVEAIRQVGGFDEKLKGTGEDQDAAFRVKEAGWLIKRSPAIFYEKRAQNWHEVWRKWIWYGFGDFALYCKNRKIFSPLGMNPLAGLIRGFLLIPNAYRLIRRKIVLLLPFHLSFEMAAWCIGFTKGHKNRNKQVQ